MLDVYEYSDPNVFLRDVWLEKKKKNPAFSMRAWAKMLGFQSNAQLSLMLAGKRKILKGNLSKLVESLQLSPKEGLYLETLAAVKYAKSPVQQSYYTQQLRELNPNCSVQMTEVETYKYLGNPLHCLILEMSDLKGFKPEAKWLQDRMQIKPTLAEIEEAIDRLFALGLLIDNGQKGFKKTNQHVTSRKDIVDKGVQEYHKRVSEMAIALISRQDPLEREFNSYSFNVKKEDIPAAKENLRKYVEKFMDEFESPPGDGEETYQLNVQFFGLTKK